MLDFYTTGYGDAGGDSRSLRSQAPDWDYVPLLAATLG